METTANLAASTADAAGIINTIGHLPQNGFFHVMFFMVTLFLCWYIWQEHKDREKTKNKREEQWVQHQDVHRLEQEKINDRFSNIDRNLDRLNLLIQTFDTRLSNIDKSCSELNGTLNTLMRMKQI